MTNDRHRLYHGTSWAAAAQIAKAGVFLARGPHLSLSVNPNVSVYWASLAGTYDRDLLGVDGRYWAAAQSKPPMSGVVFAFDRNVLIENDAELSPYSDEVFGTGACDWEEEIACLTPAHKLGLSFDTIALSYGDLGELDRLIAGVPRHPGARRALEALRERILPLPFKELDLNWAANSNRRAEAPTC